VNRVLFALAKNRKWEVATGLFKRLERRKRVTSESIGCVLAALDISGKWERALEMFVNVKIQYSDLRPTALMYCTAIHSLECLGKRTRALELYSEMGKKSLRT